MYGWSKLLVCDNTQAAYYYIHYIHDIIIIIIIIISIKKDYQCKAGRGRLAPYQSGDPSPTLPTYRGKEKKLKIVEDKNGESI